MIYIYDWDAPESDHEDPLYLNYCNLQEWMESHLCNTVLMHDDDINDFVMPMLQCHLDDINAHLPADKHIGVYSDPHRIHFVSGGRDELFYLEYFKVRHVYGNGSSNIDGLSPDFVSDPAFRDALGRLDIAMANRQVKRDRFRDDALNRLKNIADDFFAFRRDDNKLRSECHDLYKSLMVKLYEMKEKGGDK
jgi:hypothetical protein